MTETDGECVQKDDDDGSPSSETAKLGNTAETTTKNGFLPSNGDGNDVEALLSDIGNLLTENIAQNDGDKPKGSVSNGLATVNSGAPHDVSIDKMYDVYSQQFHEIERLEKENQTLKDQSTGLQRARDEAQQQLRDLTRTQEMKAQENEKRVNEYEAQLKTMRDRFAAQDTHFRKLLADQQSKFNAQSEQLKRSTETAQREKDAAVIKYAQREKELLTMDTTVQRCQQQMQQLTVERDALNSRLRGAKSEKQQLVQILEQKDNEIGELKKECERVKSFVQEADLRVKLANKRVDDSDSACKEAKLEQEKLQKRLKESKEETETMRVECQRMIREYQAVFEKKKIEVEVQKQEHSDQEEIYRIVVDELESLKRQHKETLSDNEKLKTEISSVNEELSAKRQDSEKRVSELETERKFNDELQIKLQTLENCVEQLNAERKKSQELSAALNRAQQDRDDFEHEAEDCRANVERMLALMEQLTQKNSSVQAENCSLSMKVVTAEAENAELGIRVTELESMVVRLEEELSTLKASSSSEIRRLGEELGSKTRRETELVTSFEDEQNRNQILKKKHAASLKELKAELSLMKRRLEAFESGTASQDSGGSVVGDDRDSQHQFSVSRASSYTSLDVASSGKHGAESPTCVPDGLHTFANPHHSQQHQGVCEHNQAIIEKIVKLQRRLARREEKIGFLEEHVKVLLEELKKKTKLVQMYALRDQSGALAPVSADMNKVEMIKRGQTTMSSVFTGSTPKPHYLAGLVNSDGQISLELALQISAKLQALLEDTLLKNIALKESMETLGEEIARLSRENRKLELEYQSKK